MSTRFKNFQNQLYRSDVIPDVMKSCRTHKSDVAFSYDRVCLTYDDNRNYRDINNNIISALPTTLDDGTTIEYGETTTYRDLEKVYIALTDAGTLNNYNIDLSEIEKITDSDSSFNTYHSDNINLYTNMKTKRNSLDTKMRELYEDENTDNQLMYENTAYANLSLTIFATCMLYFLFTKL